MTKSARQAKYKQFWRSLGHWNIPKNSYSASGKEAEPIIDDARRQFEANENPKKFNFVLYIKRAYDIEELRSLLPDDCILNRINNK